MAKVKLDLVSLSDEGLVQKAASIKAAMTGNASFTTPIPTLINYGTFITNAQTALDEHTAAQQAAKMKTTAKDAAMDALRTATAQLGAYVEAASGGDAVKIESAGMEVQSARTPIGTPAQVLNLALTAGDADGQLDAVWDPVRGGKSYELELSPDPITPTSWAKRPSVTKSKATLTGLTSGARVWLHVRAVGAAGPGAWSDPAVKTVP